ncbi:lebercilin-like protein [Culicoides brevitarsis]|uniref:lebercilin-like protein n=1 Tax=Culicoides brevitarsis TaxID=469753 RepID=UPI00307BCFB1
MMKNGTSEPVLVQQVTKEIQTISGSAPVARNHVTTKDKSSGTTAPVLAKMEPSIYSSTSSTKLSTSVLNRRKVGNRAASIIAGSNDVRQRVISAKMLRVKQLQNQLNDARQHIAELTTENRLLKAIHKRQDSALSKYERSNADLPQLLNSHAEELRVWQTKVRTMKAQNKELTEKIKQKDAILLSISDQNKHLMQLNKDRNLEERERLTERVKDLEQRLIEKDTDAKLLARRLQLELKGFKTQLQQENQKYRECYGKLERAHAEIARLNNLFESLNLKGSPTFHRAKISKQRNRSAEDFDRGDKPFKVSPNKKTHESRYLSPLPRDPDAKNPSPGKLPSKLPLKQVKPMLDSALEPSLILTNNNHLDAFDASSLENEFAPLPPLHETSRKNSDIADHKKHIEEIEAKMSKCMQISVASSTTTTTTTTKREPGNKVLVAQSSDEAVFQVLMQEQQMDLERMKHQLKESTMKHEYFLDQMCDEMTKDSSPQKKTEVQVVKKKKSIDSAKKTKLLAALKAIDGNESFDKS